MKLRIIEQRNRGLTRIDLVVVVVVLLVLAVLILPDVVFTHDTRQHVNCVSNLKQINLAFQIWEGDNNNEYPMAVSVTNGGGMEWMASGNIAGCLRVVTNELSTTKILICPADTLHVYATNFENDFNNSHISYFFGVNVSNEDRPQMVLDGDDNLAVGEVPVKPGILDLSSNTPVSWTRARHIFVGDVGFADGSVQAYHTNSGLQQALEQSGLTTNRIAIP